MSRLRGLTRNELDADQVDLWDAIVGSRARDGSFELLGADGSLVGPFNAMVHAPALGRHWSALGARLRFDSVLDERLVELVICVVGAHYRAEFEFFAHAPLARRAGISDATLDALGRGEPPPLERADERAVYAVTSVLLRAERVTAGLYSEVLAVVGEPGLVELASLIGYYSALAVSLNLFAVELPPGHDLTWPDTI